MSFPNIIYGDYGDEKRAQSTRINSLPLGTLMVLPDGRKFRHARAASGTALTAGYLQTGPAVPADTMLVKSLVPNSTIAVGATSVAGSTGGTTAITTDQYRDGFLIVPASTAHPGAGRMYKVVSNNSAASGSASFTINLDLADPIETALPAGTTTFGLRANLYNQVVVCPGDTSAVAPIAGVPPVAVSAGFYCWLQRSGPAVVFNAGTVLTVGEPVVASTGVAGAVAAIAATTVTDAKNRLGMIGYGMTLGVANGFALVDLTLE